MSGARVRRKVNMCKLVIMMGWDFHAGDEKCKKPGNTMESVTMYIDM